MRFISCTLAAGLALVAIQPAFSGLLIYPAKNQTPKQQQEDKYQCFNWAQSQTGYNPMSQAGTAPQPSGPGAAPVIGGAAGGAAVGAIGGAIAGHPGRGAAIGAGVGTFGGLMRRRSIEEDQMKQQDMAMAAQQQKVSAFNQAEATCLRGKGYSVSIS